MMSIPLRSRDKFVIGGALTLLSIVAWLSTFQQAQLMNMTQAHEHMVGSGFDFSVNALLLYLLTWTVMMTAMMLPSAGPMITTYATVSRQRRSSHAAPAATGLFVFGYLLAWGGTGLIAYAISILLPMMFHTVPDTARYSIAGIVLIMAGAYQFSSLKKRCLSYCRMPLGYLMTHWREGFRGALRMGVHHGLFCIGCCWALMVILFVVGVMNLAAMALLTLFMFVEKISRHGVMFGKAIGLALFVLGTILIFYSLL